MNAAMMTDWAGGVLAASGGGPGWLLILGPLAGGGLYFGLWQHYRNTQRSHSFENETRISAQPVTGADRKVDDITGTTRSNIEGDNSGNHRSRVQRVQ